MFETMSPKLTPQFVLLSVLMTNTLVFVSSQSTVGQHGVVKYQHLCLSGGRCRYSITLPQCQPDENDCKDSSDQEDQPILTQLLQIVTQQSQQIDEQSQQIQELGGLVQNQSVQMQEQTHQIDELTGLVQNQSVQIQEQSHQIDEQSHQIDELSQLVQNLTCEQRLSNAVMRDCSGLWEYPGTIDIPGVHQIRPKRMLTAISVYCEYTTSELWTVIQRRLDGSVTFYRNWEDYKNGFGNIDGEYWLGNDNIHALTTQASYKLRIDLEDWDGSTYYAEYDRFWIEDEAHNYTLHLGEYSGTAGDSMTPDHQNRRNDGQQFSTYDRDNDNWSLNCAAYPGYRSGWWFNACTYSNLNGVYKDEGQPYGIRWYNPETGNNISSRKKATMKILKT